MLQELQPTNIDAILPGHTVITDFVLRVKTARQFFNTFQHEQSYGTMLRQTIQTDLDKLLDQPRFYQESTEEDRALLTSKLLRFRPRLTGALSIYAIFANKTYQDIVDQGGLEPFYVFWFLGSAQDDFIDTLTPSPEEDKNQVIGAIRQSIFGEDRMLYRAGYHLFQQYIDTLEAGDDQKHYLRKTGAHWYRFLAEQEATVLTHPLSMYSFDYAKRYRETQNGSVGQVLTALLNGKNCLEPDLQRLEIMLPKFSYLTQIIDDIADTFEDLEANRPSYVVGALVDNPDELAVVENIRSQGKITKLSPKQLHRYAPNAYGKISSAFHHYTDQLEQATGMSGRSINLIAYDVYRFFPSVRNLLYRINPQYANF